MGYTWFNLATSIGGMISAPENNRTLGNKSYELGNHLGNVLAVVSDRKLPVDDGVYNNAGIKTSGSPDGTIDYFAADILSATDYYAFGAPMPGRQFNNGSYRYGFNGKENDNEVKGNGNQQNYGMRIYDPRLGRFLSVDPLTGDYPWLTPYQFAANTPIVAIDLDGLENVYIHELPKGGSTLQMKYDANQVRDVVLGNCPSLNVIYVNKKGEEQKVKQFQGPNAANERAVFNQHVVQHENTIKQNEERAKKDYYKNYTSGLKSPVYNVPTPAPPPTVIRDVTAEASGKGFIIGTAAPTSWVSGNDNWSSSDGMTRNGSFMAGSDYASSLNTLAKQVNGSGGKIKEITIDVVLRQSMPGATYNYDSMNSAAQGLAEQTKAYLTGKGVTGVSFNLNYKYEAESGKSTVDVKPK